jgi:ribose transport system permease protein
VIAVGGNREAARIAGVPVRRIIFSVYVLSGFLAGISTVLSARGSERVAVSGNLYELDAIGAVVIGGTSLAGGRATIVGTFSGVLTFALIFSLMTQLNLSTEIQQVTKGLIVLGASCCSGRRRGTRWPERPGDPTQPHEEGTSCRASDSSSPSPQAWCSHLPAPPAASAATTRRSRQQ